jgi:hypothetical protein
MPLSGQTENRIVMQQALEILREIGIWLSQLWDTLHTQPGDLWREFLFWLLGVVSWLQTGNVALLFALILLVILVNRILNRRS